jgi:hypothetical protein
MFVFDLLSDFLVVGDKIYFNTVLMLIKATAELVFRKSENAQVNLMIIVQPIRRLHREPRYCASTEADSFILITYFERIISCPLVDIIPCYEYSVTL